MIGNANNVSKISERLVKPRETANNSRDLRFPSSSCSIIVNLDELVPYDGNPRKSKNPLYDQVKNSIRSRGLDHSPNITARPGATQYMIKDGGNTRLQILKELWEETRDPSFYELECKYHPWVDELDTLTGHMVENELHGSMMFIEKSLAAIKMRDLITERSSKKSLSVRKLARDIGESGWSIDHSTLSVMLYAVDALLPHLPEALWGGMGRPAIKSIRKLYESARKYAEYQAIDNSRFEKIWAAALNESDSANFSYSDLFSAISNRLREEKQIDGIGLVEAQIDAMLKDKNFTEIDNSGPVLDSSNDIETSLSVSGSSQPIVRYERAPLEQLEPPTSDTTENENNDTSRPSDEKQGASMQSSAKHSTFRENEINATRKYISDRATWIAINLEVSGYLVSSTEAVGFEVNLSEKYVPAEEYIDIQAGILALLAQLQSSFIDYPAEKINELPSKICQTLFAGDWERMVATLNQVSHIMKNDPEMVKDGLYRLYEIEPLIFELNKQLINNRNH